MCTSARIGLRTGGLATARRGRARCGVRQSLQVGYVGSRWSKASLIVREGRARLSSRPRSGATSSRRARAWPWPWPRCRSRVGGAGERIRRPRTPGQRASIASRWHSTQRSAGGAESPSQRSPASPRPREKAGQTAGRVQETQTHLAAEARVERVLVVVARAEDLHERVVGVALVERAHDLEAVCRAGAGGRAGEGREGGRSASVESVVGGSGVDGGVPLCWCSANGGCIVWSDGRGESEKGRGSGSGRFLGLVSEFRLRRPGRPSLAFAIGEGRRTQIDLELTSRPRALSS